MKFSTVIKCIFVMMIILNMSSITIIAESENDSVSNMFNEDGSNIFDDEPSANDQEGSVSENEDLTLQNDRSLFLDFFKMIIALVFVLALIYFLLKFIQKRSRQYQQSQILENLGGISVGSNKSVQIIRVGSQYYIIGVGEDVQLLTSIDDPETIEDILKQQTVKTESQPFQNILKSFQNLNRNPYKQSEFKNEMDNQLKSLKESRKRMTERYQNRDEDHYG